MLNTISGKVLRGGPTYYKDTCFPETRFHQCVSDADKEKENAAHEICMNLFRTKGARKALKCSAANTL